LISNEIVGHIPEPDPLLSGLSNNGWKVDLAKGTPQYPEFSPLILFYSMRI
jgi:hypothetical protein